MEPWVLLLSSVLEIFEYLSDSSMWKHYEIIMVTAFFDHSAC